MKPVRILAVGSPFGVDNIGQITLNRLKQRLAKQGFFQQIELIYCDRPGFYLIELMRNAKLVHLIDAVISDQPIGTIQHYHDINLFQQCQQPISSHDCGVAEAMQLAETLNLLPEKIIIHTIAIKPSHPNNKLTTKLLVACNRLARQIARELERYYHPGWQCSKNEIKI